VSRTHAPPQTNNSSTDFNSGSPEIQRDHLLRADSAAINSSIELLGALKPKPLADPFPQRWRRPARFSVPDGVPFGSPRPSSIASQTVALAGSNPAIQKVFGTNQTLCLKAKYGALKRAGPVLVSDETHNGSATLDKRRMQASARENKPIYTGEISYVG
jgi:hypothetical protein